MATYTCGLGKVIFEDLGYGQKITIEVDSGATVMVKKNYNTGESRTEITDRNGNKHNIELGVAQHLNPEVFALHNDLTTNKE